MKRGRKLQVFVSSTFTDLREERQAAVEAILSAGHIPAGMELFSAGSESQMNVIKRWIDESDVYLLILGSRYGSLEAVSDKSYTHLEYEYAVESNRPLFSVVISDIATENKLAILGTKGVEMENQHKLKLFRALVETKVVRYWDDVKDIKIAIHETLREYSSNDSLKGWISGDEGANGTALAEEMARLSKENLELRGRLSEMSPLLSNNLTFQEMFDTLMNAIIEKTGFSKDFANLLYSVASLFGRSEITLLDFFLVAGFRLRTNKYLVYDENYSPGRLLLDFDMFMHSPKRLNFVNNSFTALTLSKAGKEFLVKINLMKFSNSIATYTSAGFNKIIMEYVNEHADFLKED